MWSDPTADKVSVKIRVHSGSAFDPQGKEGVMYLLAQNFFPNEASREFFAEDLGGTLEIVNNYDYIQINATSKPESMVQLLDTLAQVVSNPTIDKETTDSLKTVLLAKLDAAEKDPAYVADQAVAKRLFGKFPYGRPLLGTKESIAKIDFADLRFAKDRFFGADNATVAITGNFNSDLAFKAVRRYLGAWLKSDKRVPSTFEQPGVPPTELQMIPSPVTGMSEMRFAGRGYSRGDKDYAAANMLASIIENRIRAKVPEEYRQKTFVRNDAHILPGAFVVGISGVKDDSPNAGSINVGDLIAKSIGQPITEADIASAKPSATDIATQWLDVDTYGLTPIKTGVTPLSVTAADVQRVANEYNKRPMVSVVVTKTNAN
jgi:predicted Zn-dependent peptidase